VGVVTQREALAVLLADRLAQACGARVHWRLVARRA
jgi:ribosomal protein S3